MAWRGTNLPFMYTFNNPEHNYLALLEPNKAKLNVPFGHVPYITIILSRFSYFPFTSVSVFLFVARNFVPTDDFLYIWYKYVLCHKRHFCPCFF